MNTKQKMLSCAWILKLGRKYGSYTLFQVTRGGWDVSRYDVWVVLMGSTLPSFYYYLSISQHLTFILPWPVGRPLILTSLPGSEIKAAHHKLRGRTMGARCKQGTLALPLLWINAKTFLSTYSREILKIVERSRLGDDSDSYSNG